jgi:hypothetical protein
MLLNLGEAVFGFRRGIGRLLRWVTIVAVAHDVSGLRLHELY